MRNMRKILRELNEIEIIYLIELGGESQSMRTFL